MDLSDPQTASSTGSPSSDTADNSSTMTPSKRDIFLSTYQHQNFAFPDSIMHYTAKNPKNTKIYQKMVKSCKYFFIKNEILIINDLRYYQNGWLAYFESDQKNIYLDKLLSRLWITDGLYFSPENLSKNSIVSSIIPKIYQCDATYLSLYDQIICLNEFMLLCSSVKLLRLEEVTVKYEDGTVVSFEKIVEQLPTVQVISYTFANPSKNTSKNTFKELWKIPHLSNYDKLSLNNIPEEFDIESFYSFMKKNKNAQISLKFSDAISEEYKTRLEAIIDEIIETENHEYKALCITFPGIDEKKFFKLYYLSEQ